MSRAKMSRGRNVAGRIVAKLIINTPFHKVYAEKSFCRCGGSRACRAERRPPLRYGRRERSEHDRSEARPSCSEDHARPTLRSSTKTVFPATIQLVITLFRIIQSS
uniref:Uncharacterized protein n=1 Tax=Meloidogyne enterolobii TaxID=390850 RepID=A0A6V7WEA0_MELEN|nr:unnamed protein product [Meloidogyne enterolobii]